MKRYHPVDHRHAKAIFEVLKAHQGTFIGRLEAASQAGVRYGIGQAIELINDVYAPAEGYMYGFRKGLGGGIGVFDNVRVRAGQDDEVLHFLHTFASEMATRASRRQNGTLVTYMAISPSDRSGEIERFNEVLDNVHDQFERLDQV